MEGQLFAVWAIIIGAGVYLTRHTLRAWGGKSSGCGKGCSCGEKKETKQTTFIPSESLTLLKR